jgi:hypothetical protein
MVARALDTTPASRRGRPVMADEELTLEERNVAVLRALYDIWNGARGTRFDHFFEALADDVRWRSLPRGAAGFEFTRCCYSRDYVLRYFEGMAADWELLFYEVDEFIAQADRVVVLSRCAFSHRRTGRTL